MRLPRILFLYVFREIVLYAVLGYVAVVAILVTQSLFDELEELAAVGFQASDALAVLGCLFAMLSAYAVPVAFLFGLLVSYGRLSADSEITAMRACGFGLPQLIAPPLAIGLLFTAATAVLVVEIEPRARRELRSVVASIASRGAMVVPGHFSRLDRRGDLLLLVQARSDNDDLQGVMISDRSHPQRAYTVFAERGRFVFEPERAEIHILLENGDLHLEPAGEDGGYRRIAFEQLDYGIDASALLTSDPARLRPHEMSMRTIQEVRAYHDQHGRMPKTARVKERRLYDAQIHRRLALSVTPLLFALVGVPLGVRRTRGARSYGALVCVGLVFSYYVLLITAERLIEEDVLPAAVAMWTPDLVFLAIAVILLRRMRYTEI